MKRSLYFWARKHVTQDNVRMLLLAIPVIVLLIVQLINRKLDWSQYFDFSVLISFALIAVCDGIVLKLRKRVAIHTEDCAKVTDDYERLVNQVYPCTEMVTFPYDAEGENIEVKYPVELLWMRESEKDNIEIEDSPDVFYRLPKQIAENSKEIMEAHSASKVYNQINIRCDNIIKNENSNDVILKTSRTNYFDSLLTNRSCDYIFGDRETTSRELYEPGPFLKPLNHSKMSNHLGFSGFVITNDGKIPFIHRKSNLSVAKNKWSTSLSASLKSKYVLSSNSNYKLTPEGVGEAIVGEVKDELGIKDHDELNRILSDVIDKNNNLKDVIAFYRDVVECGKPQFLAYVHLDDYDAESLGRILDSANKNDKKGVDTDGDNFVFLSLDQLVDAKYSMDKIIIDPDDTFSRKEYSMMPGGIASILMLLRYLKKI